MDILVYIPVCSVSFAYFLRFYIQMSKNIAGLYTQSLYNREGRFESGTVENPSNQVLSRQSLHVHVYDVQRLETMFLVF